MVIPHLKGTKTFDEIAINDVVDYIDWVFFFHAWGLPGRYRGLEGFCDCAACRQNFMVLNRHVPEDKRKEVLNLYTDAANMLKRIKQDALLSISAKIRFVSAKSADEGLYLQGEQGGVYLPLLRQQHIGEKNKMCLSIADFVSPYDDYVGFFALCVKGADALSLSFRNKGDDYNALLIKSLADRLAEATAEWLHLQVRKVYWGYSPDENFSPHELFKVPYVGIRPAIGYPSLPDQSLIFRVNSLLNVEEIGIQITENGAMRPNASICGMYISHPQSSYFMVGKIGEDQLADYAKRCGVSVDEVKKWLTHNL